MVCKQAIALRCFLMTIGFIIRFSIQDLRSQIVISSPEVAVAWNSGY